MTDKAPERITARVYKNGIINARKSEDKFFANAHDSVIAEAEYVRADTAPAVKQLSWEGDGHWVNGPDEGWMEEANTPFGWGYSIEFGRDGNFKVDSTFDWSQDGFETPDEAKVAAQADFERRVRECLV